MIVGLSPLVLLWTLDCTGRILLNKYSLWLFSADQQAKTAETKLVPKLGAAAAAFNDEVIVVCKCVSDVLCVSSYTVIM